MIELEQLKQDEGFSEKSYLCTAGYLTIGYGFNIDAGMSKAQAEAILEVTCRERIVELLDRLSWFSVAPEEVRSVLLNMAYQLGIAGLMKFKLTLGYLEQRQYDKAAKEMLDSQWARQTPERATRLSERIGQL